MCEMALTAGATSQRWRDPHWATAPPQLVAPPDATLTRTGKIGAVGSGNNRKGRGDRQCQGAAEDEQMTGERVEEEGSRSLPQSLQKLFGD